MRIPWTRHANLALALSIAGALCACGNVSHKVTTDGSGAGQLLWPAPGSVTPIHRGGTFPVVSNLRLIGTGMTKAQILPLIGAPHFNEGVWGVREWNYLFNFRAKGADAVTQCQYKILFDQHKLARGFYWAPASCASVLDDEKPDAVAHQEPALTLQPDASFAFGQSDAAHDRSEGR